MLLRTPGVPSCRIVRVVVDGVPSVTKPMIGVIGSSSCSPEVARLAEEVGKGIARKGGVLICGGLGGVMEAVCRGAKSEGGSTIGILPGSSRDDANQWVDIPIVTGMGVARNTIIVSSSQAIISVSGGYGTLSEIGFSLNLGVPIVGLLTWEIDAPIIRAETPEEAVELAFQALEKHT